MYFFLNFQMFLAFVNFFKYVCSFFFLILNIGFCSQFYIGNFAFLYLKKAPNVTSFKPHKTWICVCLGSKTCCLMSVFLLSLHITQVGKLKPREGKLTLLGKTGTGSSSSNSQFNECSFPLFRKVF